MGTCNYMGGRLNLDGLCQAIGVQIPRSSSGSHREYSWTYRLSGHFNNLIWRDCSEQRRAEHSLRVATNPVSLLETPRGFWVCFVCFHLITFLEMCNTPRLLLNVFVLTR